MTTGIQKKEARPLERLSIKLVETRAELEKLWRARYEVYAEENRYMPPREDRWISDRFDAHPKVKNIVVISRDEFVAGLRCIDRDPNGNPPETYFDFSSFIPANAGAIGTASMFWVRRRYQGTRIAYYILDSMNRSARHSGWSHIICSVNPEIQRFLSREGYKALSLELYSQSHRLPFVPMILALSDAPSRSSAFIESQKRQLSRDFRLPEESE